MSEDNLYIILSLSEELLARTGIDFLSRNLLPLVIWETHCPLPIKANQGIADRPTTIIDIRINHTDESELKCAKNRGRECIMLGSVIVWKTGEEAWDRYPVGRIITVLAFKAGDWPELPSRLAETRCLPDAKGQPTADSRQPTSGSPADSGVGS
ncbi:hypothetical protein I7I51_07556 [Histoplasma capsulatum]|uniref:Uncharacterized protein n=1 Tax=Ajellomyces capsulatus TaxID=5037 RepID=A0A8A1M012_AJECA|nr:hypothetical protein I7I51_07556 [Histoplasma capsulatum]